MANMETETVSQTADIEIETSKHQTWKWRQSNNRHGKCDSQTADTENVTVKQQTLK